MKVLITSTAIALTILICSTVVHSQFTGLEIDKPSNNGIDINQPQQNGIRILEPAETAIVIDSAGRDGIL